MKDDQEEVYTLIVKISVTAEFLDLTVCQGIAAALPGSHTREMAVMDITSMHKHACGSIICARLTLSSKIELLLAMGELRMNSDAAKKKLRRLCQRAEKARINRNNRIHTLVGRDVVGQSMTSSRKYGRPKEVAKNKSPIGAPEPLGVEDLREDLKQAQHIVRDLKAFLIKSDLWLIPSTDRSM